MKSFEEIYSTEPSYYNLSENFDTLKLELIKRIKNLEFDDISDIIYLESIKSYQKTNKFIDEMGDFDPYSSTDQSIASALLYLSNSNVKKDEI